MLIFVRVRQYIKDVIDVPDAEEKLQVNKYAQLARKDKATIIIPLKGMKEDKIINYDSDMMIVI
jgi:hypothetical protein